MSILDSIGNTRVHALERLVPASGARILLKLELENPTGSMKDRMALAMIEGAERRGLLAPGGTVVEYTGGSTGVSLAFIASVRGYRARFVTSEVFSLEKRTHTQAFGAELTLIHSPTGGTTRELTMEMIATARRLAQAPGCYWTDQFNNPDQVNAYPAMASELWRQSAGRIDALVACVGTGGSFRGLSEGLRRHDPAVQCVAVQPAESPVLTGGASGSHGIEGVGPGFEALHWKASRADAIESVSTAEAMAMARRLAREEGVFAGTSTGANLVAAFRVAERLQPSQTVVTIAADSGLKYLSTPLYRTT
jgi:cysteine synthase A